VTRSGEWVVEERTDDAATLHASWSTVTVAPDRRTVAVCRVTAPSVVLGSTQSEAVVDRGRAEAAGIAVARRSSGGGAVLVTPGDPVWVDVWVPVGDPLWNHAVDRAFDWLGEAWVEALARVGVTGTAAHRRGFVACTRWSSLVCFGGVGAGEVVTLDGRKVVGLAQRRNRDGAWFHGACVLRWDPASLIGVLALDPAERSVATAGLGSAVVGVADLATEQGVPVPDGPALSSALIASLP
jgi:lipoate---protein ligase